jgi:hypothetical protein
VPVESHFGKCMSRIRASSFCPARFYGAAVFFVEGEERRKTNAQVESLDESD